MVITWWIVAFSAMKGIATDLRDFTLLKFAKETEHSHYIISLI